MVLDHEREHPLRWAAIVSIAPKIGCTGQTLSEWLKKAERDSGRALGPTTEMAARLNDLPPERGSRCDSCVDGPRWARGLAAL
jgi:transposase